MTTEQSADDVDLLEILGDCHAVLRGHFQLSSGLHSPNYVQCALLLEDPRRAREIGARLGARIRTALGEGAIDSVLSPALGGVVIGHEVAAALGVPFRFAERKGESLEIRRGFALREGERVVIVEDVITTGKSTRETIALAESQGALVVAVASIIDRTRRSSDEPAIFEVPFESLLHLALTVFPPDDCPLCAAIGPPEKPGSRPRP